MEEDKLLIEATLESLENGGKKGLELIKIIVDLAIQIGLTPEEVEQIIQKIKDPEAKKIGSSAFEINEESGGSENKASETTT